MAVGEELSEIGAEPNAKHFSCSTKGAKRRVWEASLSSLKSKKIKGSHSIACQLDSCPKALESDGNLSCFHGYSLDTLRSKALLGVTPTASVRQSRCLEKSAEEHKSVNIFPEGPASKELQSKGECFRIMLMNIADDAKKTCLTKVNPEYLSCLDKTHLSIMGHSCFILLKEKAPFLLTCHTIL